MDENERDTDGGKLYHAVIDAVKNNSNFTLFEEGGQIYSRNKEVHEAILLLFDTLGIGDDLVTGYLDPEEDARDGVADEVSGCYYIDIC